MAEERAASAGCACRGLARRLERTWRRRPVVAVTGVLKSMIAAAGVPGGPDRDGAERHRSGKVRRLPAPDKHGPLVLGFVGFVRDWHGLDAVIRAMAADHDGTEVDLVVVGEARRGLALEQQAAALGWGSGSVHRAGAARGRPGLVAGFDIALQPRAVPMRRR